MRITPLWLFAIFSLTACAQTPLKEEIPLIRVPIGIGYMIADVSCDEVKNTSIPKRLEELEIAFQWSDEDDSLLTVGPIIEYEESGSAYSKIRQSYFLTIVCRDEVTTKIDGEAALEGLNAGGEWVAITDIPTIKQYSIQFLQSLDL